MLRDDLRRRYELLHGNDKEAARAELARLKSCGRPVVAVSACLVGVTCRFDGRAKEDEAALARERRFVLFGAPVEAAGHADQAGRDRHHRPAAALEARQFGTRRLFVVAVEKLVPAAKIVAQHRYVIRPSASARSTAG